MSPNKEKKPPMTKVAIWNNGEIFVIRTNIGKGKFYFHFPQADTTTDASAIAALYAGIRIEVNTDKVFAPELRNNIITAKRAGAEVNGFDPKPGTDFGIYTNPNLAMIAMTRHHPDKSVDELAYLEYMASLQA